LKSEFGTLVINQLRDNVQTLNTQWLNQIFLEL